MARLTRSWKADVEGRALATELHTILEISHRQAKGLIDAGCISVDGKTAISHGLRLAGGEEIKVDFESDRAYQPAPRPARSGDSPFTMLFEDRDLVFVDKPAGLLTVPSEKGNEPTLADALTDHYRRRGLKRIQVYVVHRLDRWTSGVLVFGKTPEALHGLKTLFEEHQLQRVYKAILVGELPENSGTLSGRIVENPKTLRMRVVQPRPGDAKPRGTKEAITHYRVLERLPGHTVVEIRLETGRRNQIRVQFADRGYPLLGDQVYGSTSELMDRQALHAELLGFRHPVTGDAVSASAPMPPDMEAALKALRLRHRLVRAEAGKTGEEGLFRPKITEARKQERIRKAKRYAPDRVPDEQDPRPPRTGRDFPPREDRRPREEGRPPRSDGPRPGGPRKDRPETGRPPRPGQDRPRGGAPRAERSEGPRTDRKSAPRAGAGRPRRDEAAPARPRSDRKPAPGRAATDSRGPKDRPGATGGSSRKPRPTGFKPRKPR
jgi:RluA family pseudouridine synthase